MPAPGISPVPFQSELYRRNPRHYTTSLLGWGGKSAGATATILGGRWFLDTSLSAGASLICIEAELSEIAIGLATVGNNSQSKLMWGAPIILWTEMELETTANANDRHSQAGLTFGGAGAEVSDNPSGPTVRLYARGDSNPFSYEIFTAKGSGAAGVFTPLTGIPTGGHFVYQRLMLVIIPGASVQGYVNGVLGATVTGASIPDATINLSDQGAGVYVRTSANANDETIAAFAGFQVERIGRP